MTKGRAARDGSYKARRPLALSDLHNPRSLTPVRLAFARSSTNAGHAFVARCQPTSICGAEPRVRFGVRTPSERWWRDYLCPRSIHADRAERPLLNAAPRQEQQRRRGRGPEHDCSCFVVQNSCLVPAFEHLLARLQLAPRRRGVALGRHSGREVGHGPHDHCDRADASRRPRSLEAPALT